MNESDDRRHLQDAQYKFPYHYIPQYDGRQYTSTVHWAWGHRYLGGLTVAFDAICKQDVSSLLDVGCGDGRFLREAKERLPHCSMLGVDVSIQAIRLASAMNPDIAFRCQDITTDTVNETFDVVTMIEVLEHIPPATVPCFLDAVRQKVAPKGRLVLTVPHSNKTVSSKHYQHFTADSLKRALANAFVSVEVIPFDLQSRSMWIMETLLGEPGSQYLITNRSLRTKFFNLYRRHFLYAPHESKCMRLAAICEPKP